ncbi:phage tail tube protein [Janthinobacterium sp. MDB2-8]|uniref:phage tail tube protein n=1 Tax=Janthinobacterium sp. MDB2-8 TaxID=1259338 RepID=UPI003F263BAE
MANLIVNPRKWRNKALVLATEATYALDAAPTGLLNWIEARNVSLTPMDVDRAERNIDLPYMGTSGSVIVSTWAKLAFDIAIAPSGVVGTAPKWGALLMACGLAETVTAATSVAYNLVSNVFSSATAYMVIDGTLHKLLGMRGEVKAKMSAKGLPMLSFAFDACYVTPVTGAMPTVDRTGWTLEEAINSVNTGPVNIGGVPLSFSEFDWALGNKIARMDNPGPQREILITDRKPTASITVLAPDLATFNPFALNDSGATLDLTSMHGTVAGKKFKTEMKARITGVEYAQIEEMVGYKLTLEPLPVNGNDEIALTCM